MTGMDNKELSISLEKHYDRAIGDLEKLMLSKFDSIREAILKADDYAKYRDTKQNEFRGALDDLSKRATEQSKLLASKTDVDNLDKQFNIWMSGIKQLQEANFNVAMDAVRKIDGRLTSLEGKKEGGAVVWPWVITIVMGVTTIITVLYTLLK